MRDEKKVESGNDKFPQILFTFLESAEDSAYNGHKDFPKVGKYANSKTTSRHGERSKGRHWFDPEFVQSQVDCAQKEAAQTKERESGKCHRQLQTRTMLKTLVQRPIVKFPLTTTSQPKVGIVESEPWDTHFGTPPLQPSGRVAQLE